MKRRIISLVLSMCILFSILSFPAVSAEKDWPYYNSDAMQFRPAGNYHSEQNPPHFSWPYVDNAKSYDIAVATDPEMKNVVYSKSGIERNVYNFPYIFETKTVYYWSVRFKTSSGLSSWSEPRRFIIDENAYEFPVPESAFDVASVLADKKRPYNNTDFSGIDKLSVYPLIKKYVDDFIKEPIPEADAVKMEVLDSKLSNSGELYKLWNFKIRDMLYTAMLYKISNDRTYLEHVVRMIDKIHTWNPAESFVFNQYTDTTEAMVAYHSSLVYDWIYNDISEETRKQFIMFIENLIKRPYDNWAGGKYWGGGSFSLYKTPHASHPWHINYATIAAMMIYNDSQVAKLLVSYHLPLMINYGVYNAEEDGSSTAGPFYGMHNTKSELYSVLDGMGIINIRDSAFYQNKAYTYLYLWPPHWINNIGDAYNNTTSDTQNAVIEVQTNAVDSHNPLLKNVNKWQLWKINNGKTDNVFRTSSFSSVINNKLISDFEMLPPVMLPEAKFFKDSGWVGMFNSLSDDNRVGMIFHSSPQGSNNHSHPDQNSFVIQAYGENLATDSDYYDSYSSPFDLSYNKKTFAHNAVTYNEGIGQPAYTSSANGHITEFLNGTEMVLAGADASNAYSGLSKVDRKVIYIRPETFIVIDDLKANDGNEVQYEWWLNTEGDIAFYDEGNGARISKGEVTLDAKFHWPEKLEGNYINYFAGPDLVEITPPAMASTATDKRMYFATEKVNSTKIITTLDVNRKKAGQKYIAKEEADGFIKLFFEDGTVAYIRTNDEKCIQTDGYETDALALVVKDESRMMVSGTFVSYNGIEIIKSDVVTSVQVSEDEISLSSIDNDAEIVVYFNGIESLSYINNEKATEVESGEDYGIFNISYEADYVRAKIYNGQYYFYANGKKMPGSDVPGCNFTVIVDGKEMNHEFTGYTTPSGEIYYEFLCKDFPGVYTLKSVKGVSLKNNGENSLQLVDTSTVFAVNEKEAYIELESVEAGSDISVEYYEDNNKDFDSASARKLAIEYDLSNKSPLIKHWSSLGYATLQEINNVGDSVTWNLEVPEDGKYDIILSYSTVSKTSPERILRLDDKYGMIKVKETDVYSNLNGMRIRTGKYLTKGTHQLEIIAYGEGTWILDWVGLAKSDL